MSYRLPGQHIYHSSVIILPGMYLILKSYFCRARLHVQSSSCVGHTLATSVLGGQFWVQNNDPRRPIKHLVSQGYQRWNHIPSHMKTNGISSLTFYHLEISRWRAWFPCTTCINSVNDASARGGKTNTAKSRTHNIRQPLRQLQPGTPQSTLYSITLYYSTSLVSDFLGTNSYSN